MALKPSKLSSLDITQAYKTSDGRLFEDKQDAEDWQWSLDILPSIKAHCGTGPLARNAINVILHWERTKLRKEKA